MQNLQEVLLLLTSKVSVPLDLEKTLHRICDILQSHSYFFITGCVSITGRFNGWTELEAPKIIASSHFYPEKLRQIETTCEVLPSLLRKTNLDLQPFYFEYKKAPVNGPSVQLQELFQSWISEPFIGLPAYGPRLQFSLLLLPQLNKDRTQLEKVWQSFQLYGPAIMAYINTLLRPMRIRGTSARLTARAFEVMEWTAKGKSAQEIAVILDLSPDTVDFHLKTIKQKLDVTNKTHAVARLYHCDQELN